MTLSNFSENRRTKNGSFASEGQFNRPLSDLSENLDALNADASALSSDVSDISDIRGHVSDLSSRVTESFTSISDVSNRLAGWDRGSVTTEITSDSEISSSDTLSGSRVETENFDLRSGNSFVFGSDASFAGEVRQNVVDRSGQVYNVRAFGAAGDGAAVDTSAFSQALQDLHDSGGGTLLVPPGDYVLDDQIKKSDFSRIEIRGHGFPKLDFTSVDNLGGEEGLLDFERPEDLAIRGLKFDSSDNIDISIEGGKRCWVQDSRFSQSVSTYNVSCVNLVDDVASSVTTSSDLFVTHNVFRPASNAVLAKFDSNSTRFGRRIHLSDNAVDGSVVTSVQGVFKTDAGVREVSIQNNTIDGGDNADIAIAVTQNTANAAVRGNVIHDVRNSGIFLDSGQGDEKVQHVVVDGNVIEGGNLSQGIRLDPTTADFRDIIISNNVIRDPTRIGIEEIASGTSGLVISGNIIDGIAGGGVAAFDIRGNPRLYNNVTLNSGSDSVRLVSNSSAILYGNDFDTDIAGDQRAQKIDGFGSSSSNAEAPNSDFWDRGDIVEFTDSGDGSGTGMYILSSTNSFILLE